MPNHKKFPRYFLPHIATIMGSLILSTALLASPPKQEPIEENCNSEDLAEAKRNQGTTDKQSYEQYCVGCHSADGKGIPEIFPPLKNSEWTSNSHVLANIILRGVSGTIYVDGVRYASAMQGFAAELSDEEVLAIVRYVQEGINEHKTTITVSEIAQIRAKDLGRISSQQGLDKLHQQYVSEP